MFEAFRSGGVLMWPLLIIMTGIVVQLVRTGIRARRSGEDMKGVDHSLHSIIAWGVMAGIVGLLGTAVGLLQMAQVISRYGGNVSAPTLWDGFGVTLITTIFGLLILILSVGGWFLIRYLQDRRPSLRSA